MEDILLAELSEEIDNKFIEWLVTYKVPTLNLAAILLARLTHIAKESDCTEDFLRLLEAPKEVLTKDDKDQVVH
jgi:hypothetical protein